jgi:hypothetical protein
LPLWYFEGAYSNEPAQSFGLTKHLHKSVNTTAMCNLTQEDYYGRGVSYTPIASLFFKERKILENPSRKCRVRPEGQGHYQKKCSHNTKKQEWSVSKLSILVKPTPTRNLRSISEMPTITGIPFSDTPGK